MWQHLSRRQLFRLGWIGALGGLGTWLGKAAAAPARGTDRLPDSLAGDVVTYSSYEAADGWGRKPRGSYLVYDAQDRIISVAGSHTETKVYV